MADRKADGAKAIRWVRWGLWGLVAVALGGVLWWQVLGPRVNTALRDIIGNGDYELVATDGSTFTQKTLRGSPSLVFFGFTHCPEVCPTTLSDISVWQEELGDAAEELRVYFVTVDPERDTVETLADYVGWVPGTLGVSGTPEEVEKAIKAFHIYARKIPLDDGDYTMDHSAYVMLFDEKGRFVEPIGYQEDFDIALAKLRRLLGT